MFETYCGNFHLISNIPQIYQEQSTNEWCLFKQINSFIVMNTEYLLLKKQPVNLIKC